MILAAAFAAGQIGGLSSYYFELPEVARAGCIALGLTAIAVILLPAAPLEVLFGGLAAALLVVSEPWQGLLFQPAHKGGDFTPIWLRVVIFASAWTVLLAVLYATANALAARAKKRPLRYRLFVPGGDATELRRLLDLRPESTSGPVTYGARQWDGWVPTRMFIRSYNADFDMSDIYVDYAVKALRSDGDTDVFAIRDDHGAREGATTGSAPRGAALGSKSRSAPDRVVPW